MLCGGVRDVDLIRLSGMRRLDFCDLPSPKVESESLRVVFVLPRLLSRTLYYTYYSTFLFGRGAKITPHSVDLSRPSLPMHANVGIPPLFKAVSNSGPILAL